MNMTISRACVLVSLCLCGWAIAGCNVSVDDGPGTSGVFACDTDSQCVTVNGTGYECRSMPDVGNVCVDESRPVQTRCKDDDNDGWGVIDGDRTTTSKCAACNEDRYRGCEKDCGPNETSTYPGYFDPCNGTDSDCDGETDDYVLCQGPDFDDDRTTLPPGDRRDVFCQNFPESRNNKASTKPDNTEFECRPLNSGDENEYCLPVDTGSGSGCSSKYVCSGGNWSCDN